MTVFQTSNKFDGRVQNAENVSRQCCGEVEGIEVGAVFLGQVRPDLEKTQDDAMGSAETVLCFMAILVITR